MADMSRPIIIGQTYHSTLETCVQGDTVVVIKRPRNTDDPRTQARWRKEVDALKLARTHDNIASIIASDPSSLTITLRLESGQGLDKFIDDHERCTVAPAEGEIILRQMASALSHLHARRLTHDDVKPDNIIWDPSGKRAVLVDFGAALDFTTLPENYFNPSGTPNYVPPEFLDRRKGPEGDIWALGIVMMFIWGYVKLPDGGWLLPGVWDEGGDTEMREWLREVKVLRDKAGKQGPWVREALEEDPGRRVGSAALVQMLLNG